MDSDTKKARVVEKNQKTINHWSMVIEHEHCRFFLLEHRLIIRAGWFLLGQRSAAHRDLGGGGVHVVSQGLTVNLKKNYSLPFFAKIQSLLH